jgi:hypothetical protein
MDFLQVNRPIFLSLPTQLKDKLIFRTIFMLKKMLELEQMLTLYSTEKDMITQDTVDILIENLCNIFVTFRIVFTHILYIF